MRFKSLLIFLTILFSGQLFAQVPCEKLSIDNVYFNPEFPNVVWVTITNHDEENLWSPRLVGLLNLSNDTLASRSLCGCVALLPGNTEDFFVDLVQPFAITNGFSCTIALQSTLEPIETCKYTYTASHSNISAVARKTKIVLFPNPAKNTLTIDIPVYTSDNNRITVVNLQGQTLFSQAIVGQKANMDVSSFKPGIYFVHLYSNGSLLTTSKLVVE